MLNKKSIKVINIAILVIMLLMIFGNTALAITVPEANDGVGLGGMESAVSNILGIMKAVGIATAAVVAMYLGISYITKSPEGKAEIKKQLPLFIGGIAVVLFATAIVSFIADNLGG